MEQALFCPPPAYLEGLSGHLKGRISGSDSEVPICVVSATGMAGGGTQVDQASNMTKPLVEGALLAGITVVLALAGFYIPVAGLVIAFLWPVPVALVALRHGLKVGTLTVTVAGLLLTAFVGPLQALTMALTFGLVGIAFGHAVRRGWSPSYTLVVGTAAMLVSFLAGFFLGLLFLGIGLAEFESQIREGIEASMEIYRGMGVAPDVLEQMEEFWAGALEAFRLILPAALVGAAALNAFINFQVLKAVLTRLGYSVQALPPFERWGLPKWTLGIFIVGLLAVMLENYHGIQAVRLAGLNAYTLMNLALTVQGVAFGFYLMGKYNVSKAFKVFVVVALFLFPITQNVAMLMGLYDLASDYRRREVSP
jgi:uncharacterized protein YybS (DUF2232 family)